MNTMRFRFLIHWVVIILVGVLIGSHCAAQIFGYPLPGTTQYIHEDGRRLGRIVCTDDSMFNTVSIVASEDRAVISSEAAGVPSVILYNFTAGQKELSRHLEIGVPAIRCGQLAPHGQTIFYGAGSHLLEIDTETLNLVRNRNLNTGDIRDMIIHPETGHLIILCRSSQDKIIVLDSQTWEFTSHAITGCSQVARALEYVSHLNRFYLLADTIPSSVIEITDDTFQVLSSITIPSSYLARSFTTTPAGDELLVGVPGTSPFVARYLIPGLVESSPILLQSNEYPESIICKGSDYVYVCDGDSSGGIIRLNRVLLQWDSRVDFDYECGYPIAMEIDNQTAYVVTRNRPGAIVSVSLDGFSQYDSSVFEVAPTDAGAVLVSDELERVYLSTMNQGEGRIAVFDWSTFSELSPCVIPEISMPCSHAVAGQDTLISWWLESSVPAYLSQVDLSTGNLQNRQVVSQSETVSDLLYSAEFNHLILLTESRLKLLDPESLEELESVPLSADIIPATDLTIDPDRSCVYVGSAENIDRIDRYDGEALSPLPSISLDGTVLSPKLLEYSINEDALLVIARDGYSALYRYDIEEAIWSHTLPLGVSSSDIVSMNIFPVLNQLLIQSQGAPTQIIRIDTDGMNRLNDWVLADGETAISFGCSPTRPLCFYSLAGSPSAVGFGTALSHDIQGSWSHLNETGDVQAVQYYSHQSGGEITLGIYDEALRLRWQSPPVLNTAANEWVKVEVSQGQPMTVQLDPGRYLLAWNLEGETNVPSVTTWSAQSGLRTSWQENYLPTELTNRIDTASVWSIYADYMSVHPTATPQPTETPTGVPTSVPTVTPSATPVSTQTPVPTQTSMPDPTITPTPTHRPGSGVELRISETTFFPGDEFILSLWFSNVDPHPVDVDLYLALECFGEYWFAPGWDESPQCYDIAGLLGNREWEIFRFIWPEVAGQASGLRFMSAMVTPGDQSLFGFYDIVEFGYDSHPQTPTQTPPPTETPTGSDTATPAPTATQQATATPATGQLEITILNDDPMTYSGQFCDLVSVYCFRPERLEFCSDWRSIVMIENNGQQTETVILGIAGADQDAFESEYDVLNISPREAVFCRVRFCPGSPPDVLKTAVIMIQSTDEVHQVELRGWSVAG